MNINESLETYWRFRLGEKVRDGVTGFKGVITARVEYLNGCLQYCVEPKVGKEGKGREASLHRRRTA